MSLKKNSVDTIFNECTEMEEWLEDMGMNDIGSKIDMLEMFVQMNKSTKKWSVGDYKRELKRLKEDVRNKIANDVLLGGEDE